MTLHNYLLFIFAAGLGGRFLWRLGCGWRWRRLEKGRSQATRRSVDSRDHEMSDDRVFAFVAQYGLGNLHTPEAGPGERVLDIGELVLIPAVRAQHERLG